MRCFEWWHFQWPSVTPNLSFKVTVFLEGYVSLNASCGLSATAEFLVFITVTNSRGLKTDPWCRPNPTFTSNAIAVSFRCSNGLCTLIHHHDCIHQPFWGRSGLAVACLTAVREVPGPFVHSCLPQSPSSDPLGTVIKCVFQIYKSKVDFLLFTLIFLLHLLYLTV